VSFLHVNRTLALKRKGNVLSGYATAIQTGDIFDGSEQFMVVARSRAALKRRLTELFPDMPVATKSFLKVKITLEQ
jgi:hypothetical protein